MVFFGKRDGIRVRSINREKNIDCKRRMCISSWGVQLGLI